MNKTLLSLSMIFRPNYWLMNNKYSESWDKELTELLERDTFKEYSSCEAEIGNIRIWTANHPYASFSPSMIDVRPSRATIYLAREKLEKDLLKG